MGSNLEKGSLGEIKATEYLMLKKYKILGRNYRTKIGEIDIIASKDDLLIFIEVKSRTSLNYGYPYEAVNWRKKDKIIKTSLLYMRNNNLHNYQMRYDIIEVYLRDKLKINHIENAF